MVAFNPLSLQTSDNQLTTGGDNQLLFQLVHAINYATEIEITVSFIQRSGLNLLYEPFKDALRNGASLKILTSDYLDITDPVALRELIPLIDRGADIRIFASGKGTQSFHMKSYIFVKTAENVIGGNIIDGCAFIGSNNISKSALTDGLEWCFRHDYHLPSDSYSAVQFENIRAEFNKIFAHPNVVSLDNQWISDYIKRRKKVEFVAADALTTTEPVVPNAIQVEALMALTSSREIGFQRGLVVLATGMGKTWLAAFDVKQLQAKRVLFVAHREEILLQAQRTFAHLLSDKTTGWYNAKKKDKDVDILFASVQTLGRKNHLKHFPVDHFDYIVVDEFHHASAPVYRKLLAYFQSRFLLGLTATPERTDQADILSLCDNNLVFERNLTQGIDDEILVPFNYYGIWDESVDYSAIPWRNGRFDPENIDNQFATKKRAKHVLKHWNLHKQSRTLAFCISIKHAEYMAQSFVEAGVKAVAVYANSTVRRNEALSQLKSGAIDVIFSVDLFNEGMDLPEIDTILMLRPTESKIIFLQQLGRGLRSCEHKQQLIVLDFIGNHHSFLNKPYALLSVSTPAELFGKLKEPTLAEGCFVNYDLEVTDFWEKLAKQQRTTAVEDYRELQLQLGYRPTASEFYLQYGDLKKVNKQHSSWMELVAIESEDDNLKSLVEKHRQFLFEAVQTTSMTKCFKAILLESFLRLDGFVTPPSLDTLARDSRLVLDRYPHLSQSELPAKIRKLTANSAEWLSYWKSNPIKAFCNNNKKTGAQWFRQENNCLIANLIVKDPEKQLLHDLVQELLDLRLLQYSQRKDSKKITIASSGKASL